MQTLFEWDLSECDPAKIDEVINRNVQNFAPGIDDTSFVEQLVKGVIKKREKIDSIIEKAAPEWPLGQIASVDRNVLRLGLFELLFGNKKEVPYKVAINEAIELAKTFGGDSSGKFVNGVLGTVFREMGGEDAVAEQERIIEEKLSGAVAYREDGKKILFALVHDVFGYWTLSKGRINPDDDPKIGAKKGILEEIGLNVEIKEEVGKNEYIASDPERGKIRKIVTYYLAPTTDKEIKLKETGGLDDAKWFEMKDLADLKIYDDIRTLIANGIKLIKK